MDAKKHTLRIRVTRTHSLLPSSIISLLSATSTVYYPLLHNTLLSYAMFLVIFPHSHTPALKTVKTYTFPYELDPALHPQATLLKKIRHAIDDGDETNINSLTEQLATLEDDPEAITEDGFDVADAVGKALALIE
ncbi:hypothetical protein P692DRAFT_20884077 [Suillus brevipes Sb2]|nr:hypothetical protein P692DRAFT_20884077 [Suillus brevipes Sb2]